MPKGNRHEVDRARTHGQAVLAPQSRHLRQLGNVTEGNREDIIKCRRNSESEKNIAPWTPTSSRARGEAGHVKRAGSSMAQT